MDPKGKVWLSKVVSNPARIYFLQWSRNAGDMLYFFVSVPLEKEDSFKQKLTSNESFDLEEYGVVIRWGHGKPDDAVLAEMKEKFNFEVA